MKNLFIIPAASAALFMTACGGSSSSDDSIFDSLYDASYDITIDNGLDTSATVTITGTEDTTSYEYEIAGYGIEEIELKEGTYHVTAVSALDSTFLDEDFSVDGSGYSYNLNLTKQDYIVERVMYVVSENPDAYTTSKSFTYDGKTYDEVDAYVISGELLVAKDWDYNLEEEMPEEVTIYGDQNSTTKTKLYRGETFVLYLELYELFGDMDLSEGGDELGF